MFLIFHIFGILFIAFIVHVRCIHGVLLVAQIPIRHQQREEDRRDAEQRRPDQRPSRRTRLHGRPSRLHDILRAAIRRFYDGFGLRR